ncbi:MAG: hypothetical protein KME64_33840 [Scytonematopsis contorta HA4267-MV1]|jgi:hypothetical protein|nr:hypothetical protein [Scytonematopsis contorta HA4267-MV1]
MSFVRFIQPIVRSFRFVIAAALCVTLLFSNAFPAAAIGTNKSAPDEATTQLNNIQKGTDEVAKSDPLSLEETQARTQNGLNEIQGDADKDKMYRPSNSKDARTVEDQVGNLLNKVTKDK